LCQIILKIAGNVSANANIVHIIVKIPSVLMFTYCNLYIPCCKVKLQILHYSFMTPFVVSTYFDVNIGRYELFRPADLVSEFCSVGNYVSLYFVKY
jgi:hypothetical protein